MPESNEERSGDWWTKHGRTFAASALGVGAVLFGLGAYTGARAFVYGTLLTLGTIAFLPFVIILELLSLTVFVMVIGAVAAALSGTGVDVDVEAPIGGIGAAAELVPGYYRLLGRIRHPAAFGGVAGAVLAMVGLWGLMLVTVVPKEIETRERLLAAKAAVEAAREAEGDFPAVPTSGLLPAADLGLDNRDGFGNPLAYEVSGRWKLKSYEIRSLGEDGERSDDDMCIRGESDLARRVDSALDAVLRRVLGDDASFEDDLASLEAMRC